MGGGETSISLDCFDTHERGYLIFSDTRPTEFEWKYSFTPHSASLQFSGSQLC